MRLGVERVLHATEALHCVVLNWNVRFRYLRKTKRCTFTNDTPDVEMLQVMQIVCNIFVACNTPFSAGSTPVLSLVSLKFRFFLHNM